MKKIELKLRKLLRTIFGCISLTAVAFVFQACYGPGPDPYYDIRLTGVVKSKTSKTPIKGIKITVNNGKIYNNENGYGMTDENGKFDFYTSVPDYGYYNYRDSINYSPDSVRIHFLDIDGLENGHFSDKTIIINPAHKDEVKINVELDTKQ